MVGGPAWSLRATPVDHLRDFFKILKNSSQLSAELANRSLPQPKPTTHNQNPQHTAKTHSKPPHSIAQTTTSQKPKLLGQIRKTPETQILFLPKDCHQRGCFGRVITITGPSLAPCHHRLMVALLEGREIGHGNWEGRERESVSIR